MQVHSCIINKSVFIEYTRMSDTINIKNLKEKDINVEINDDSDSNYNSPTLAQNTTSIEVEDTNTEFNHNEVTIEDTTDEDTNIVNEINDEDNKEFFSSSLKDVDIISYYGGISRAGYFLLTQLIENKIAQNKKSDKILLVLTTPGGDPDYGYRIGRALNHHYNHVTIMISDICKSAGTLVAISAHKLIIGDLGELGPLDIQLSKADEMGEQASSLNIFKTITELQKATLDSFRHFVTDIRFGSRVSTKLSAEIASNLTKTLISPISAQIDPIKLGEQKRALQIAKEYATRLNDLSNNLRPSALERLINDYPCHSFVIDRKEAKELFNNVTNTTDEEEEIIYKFSRLYLYKIGEEQLCSYDYPHITTFEKIIEELHNN